MPKECEKLFVEKKPKPLPLPTLKLSEPPGAVRPDGNQPSLQYACSRTVTSNLITISPIEIMLLKCATQQKMHKDPSAGKQKNKLSP
jgi:hypothetical protein